MLALERTSKTFFWAVYSLNPVSDTQNYVTASNELRVAKKATNPKLRVSHAQDNLSQAQK